MAPHNSNTGHAKPARRELPMLRGSNIICTSGGAPEVAFIWHCSELGLLDGDEVWHRELEYLKWVKRETDDEPQALRAYYIPTLGFISLRGRSRTLNSMAPTRNPDPAEDYAATPIFGLPDGRLYRQAIPEGAVAHERPTVDWVLTVGVNRQIRKVITGEDTTALTPATNPPTADGDGGGDDNATPRLTGTALDPREHRSWSSGMSVHAESSSGSSNPAAGATDDVVASTLRAYRADPPAALLCRIAFALPDLPREQRESIYLECLISQTVELMREAGREEREANALLVARANEAAGDKDEDEDKVLIGFEAQISAARPGLGPGDGARARAVGFVAAVEGDRDAGLAQLTSTLDVAYPAARRVLEHAKEEMLSMARRDEGGAAAIVTEARVGRAAATFESARAAIEMLERVGNLARAVVRDVVEEDEEEDDEDEGEQHRKRAEDLAVMEEVKTALDLAWLRLEQVGVTGVARVPRKVEADSDEEDGDDEEGGDSGSDYITEARVDGDSDYVTARTCQSSGTQGSGSSWTNDETECFEGDPFGDEEQHPIYSVITAAPAAAWLVDDRVEE
ncbi:hypothetical protein QBC33DRAFT_590663 [Phialemonium atrogriseum]|uniref:Uncharacterized protein n=1 Tax=Phialemonium atrogriseum TaxID=1093897 RepID=A0AAJ0BWJ5_9PEZI|nr:uncharacterized protein QBC33DRAFT_590663 [Phialemonium atrogriseum]KAK1765788.1 hypothetical protein QBC33DRAFT_590663 [Phialemonium atrogriseum]